MENDQPDTLEDTMNPYKEEYLREHDTYRQLMEYLRATPGNDEVKSRGWEHGIMVYSRDRVELKTQQHIDDARDDARQPFTTFWLPNPEFLIDFFPQVMRKLTEPSVPRAEMSELLRQMQRQTSPDMQQAMLQYQPVRMPGKFDP